MISMPQVQSIRRLRRNGESVASIARKTHVSEPTVRKYLAKEDLSAVPSVRKPRASVIDPYLPVIEQWLAEDRANWRKQRHTATRIWERLRDEHGAEVSLSTVTRAVARLRREFAAERDEAFMDLVWHPGEAQADFGEVDVLLRGVVQRMHHFVLDFPYSNVGLVQLMPGENAECTCLALRNLFEWLGGVPERIVFDNAAGVGHKGYGEREPRLTHLFQAFQAHYGFDCSFCNPYSGHEKGAVESKVGMVRRKLFVPRPSVWSLENFNAGLPDRCLELATEPHCRKDTEERGLFSEDRAALLPLPGKRFDVGRVAAYEGRPVRRGHARGTASLFRGPGERGQRGGRGPPRARGRGPRLVGQAPGDPSSDVRPGQHERRGPVHAVGAAARQARVLAQQPGT